MASLRSVGFEVKSTSYDLPWEIENYLPDTLIQQPVSVKADPFSPQFDGRFELSRGHWVEEKLGTRPFRDSDLRHLNSLRQLQVLDLTNALVSDDGLIHLKHLHNLRELYLSSYSVFRSDMHPVISDAGLVHLQGLHRLEVLHLDGADVSDSGLSKLLPNLKNLRELYLNQATVSDESVSVLAELRNLKVLNLSRTGVTEAGKDRLQSLLPRCYIWYESDDGTQSFDKLTDGELK